LTAEENPLTELLSAADSPDGLPTVVCRVSNRVVSLDVLALISGLEKKAKFWLVPHTSRAHNSNVASKSLPLTLPAFSATHGSDILSVHTGG